MKKGDTFPVAVQGITVAQAVVEAVESDRVTLLIPGTRAVVGIRTTLTDESKAPEKETIIDGTVSSTPPVEESTAAPVAAPAVEAVAEQQAAPAEAPVQEGTVAETTTNSAE